MIESDFLLLWEEDIFHSFTGANIRIGGAFRQIAEKYCRTLKMSWYSLNEQLPTCRPRFSNVDAKELRKRGRPLTWDIKRRMRGRFWNYAFQKEYRLAHTVKGIGGNISATELYAAAGAVEKAIGKGETEDLTALLDRLHEALSEILGAAEILGSRKDRAGGGQSSSEASKIEGSVEGGKPAKITGQDLALPGPSKE